ncbi:MAG: DUF4931 domain-containing protein [Patescibacteria group bacterium]|nr:DUF4931 domain-containing protein [Patescibacteria group bacterium]
MSMSDSEFRKHYFLNDVALLAPCREKRKADAARQLGPKPSCPFCNNQEPATLSTNDENGWVVKSVLNKNPILTRPSKSAHGDHEVIIETPKHITKYSDLGEHQIRLLLEFYSKKIAQLRQSKDTETVILYKNSGTSAAATINHIHSQVATLPFTPGVLKQSISSFAEYHKKFNKCQMCDIIKSEISENVRLVFDSHTAVAFTPFASFYPYELWVMPKDHLSSFAFIGNQVFRDFAKILKIATKLLDDKQYDYNFTITDTRSTHNHTYLRITPRNKSPYIAGGFEIATNINVGVISPEKAAEAYQELVH